MICGNPETVTTVTYVSKGTEFKRPICKIHINTQPEEVRIGQETLLSIFILLTPLLVIIILGEAQLSESESKDSNKHKGLAVCVVSCLIIVPLGIVQFTPIYRLSPAGFLMSGFLIIIGLILCYVVICAIIANTRIPIPSKIKSEATRVWNDIRSNITFKN